MPALLSLLGLVAFPLIAQTTPADPRLDRLKKELVADIDSRAKFTQEVVDQIFSFGELGFQEFETQRYLTAILEREGFTVERGVAGIPSAWTRPTRRSSLPRTRRRSR